MQPGGLTVRSFDTPFHALLECTRDASTRVCGIVFPFPGLSLFSFRVFPDGGVAQVVRATVS